MSRSERERPGPSIRALDPATLKVLDIGLSRHAPVIPLRSYGPVTRLV